MKVDMRRFTIVIIFFAVVCLQRMINMWEGNKRLNTMYEKCNNIVEMLTVITEGSEDSPLTHLWGLAPR